MDVLELLLGSAALVACTVLLCELLRWAFHRTVPTGLGLELALEVVCTVQLCCCTLEMNLLCTKSDLEFRLVLVLIYLLTVLHCLTFQSANCNPCGSVIQWLQGLTQGSQTVLKVVVQFVGAGLSWVLMTHLWSLGLSPLHQLDKDCKSPLQVSPLAGALIEMTCALTLYLILHPLPMVSVPLRPHMVALTITGIASVGGPLTGAIFNPVLAFAVVFWCHGHSYLQYIIVYWIGPLIGMLLSFLLLEYMLPKLKPRRVSLSHVKGGLTHPWDSDCRDVLRRCCKPTNTLHSGHLLSDEWTSFDHVLSWNMYFCNIVSKVGMRPKSIGSNM